ncbi:hypothetical protein FQA39_LY04944 [Lamprigera yunnana]|nr:hypothetical protein FQA39_LY04944 [Lamprigera yunnana]
MSNREHLIYGPKDESGIPEESMGKFYFDLLRKRNPNDVVYIDAFTEEKLTCADLLVKSKKLSIFFYKMHIEKDDVIGIYLRNDINYIIPILSCLYVGAIANLISANYKDRELKHVLSITRPKLVICEEDNFEKIIKFKKDFECLHHIFIYKSANNQSNGFSSIEDALKDITERETKEFLPIDVVDCRNQCGLIFQSSGTTGLPKAVLLNHENIRSMAVLMKQHVNLEHGDVTLLYFPMFHTYGFIIHTTILVHSLTGIVMDHFQPKKFLETIQKYKPKLLFVVSQILNFLATSDLISQYSLTSIQDVLSGASFVGINLIKKLRMNIRQMYGLTETSGPITFQLLPNNKKVTIGKVAPGCVAKVYCAETNQSLGPNLVGELCFKGASVMKGYYRNEIETKQAIDDDGFLHTGDLGYYDEEQNFYIIDRKKETIKYKSYQVSPSEIEELLLTHPDIKDCGVVGKKHDLFEQVAMAFVVLQNNASSSDEEIIKFVSDNLSVQKHLHGGVKFVQEIPRTASGKIARYKLKE